jgi:hypothetical protein
LFLFFIKYCDDRFGEDNMGKTCSTHVKMRNAYNNLVVKPQRKRSLWRPRGILGNNIKIDPKGIVREVVYWIELF